jgi:peptidoglycan/LPS O-acetylase OafA/YrhL
MTRTVITNIQVLRFIAAACILLMHAADLLIPHYSGFFAFPWNAGVDLFFTISGFIMTWLTWHRFGERGVPCRFLLRRVVRIVPPYWFFTTMMVCAVVVVPGHVHWTSLGAPQILTSYAFLPWPRPSDGKLNPLLSQGWTLNYEAFFYLAFAVALCFRKGLRWLFFAFVGLAAVNFAVPDRLFVLKFYSDPIILEFLAGIAVALLYIRGIRLSRLSSLATAVLAILTYLSISFLAPSGAARFLQNGLPAALLLGSFALLPEPKEQGSVRRFLRLGGDSSYTLYLSHTFIANTVAAIALSYWPGGIWWALPAAILSSILFAVLFYRFIERPTTEALSRYLGLTAPNDAQRVAP